MSVSVTARGRLRAVLAWGEDAVLGGKGGEIGEGSCPVKMDELDGPLRGRILFDEVDGAWVKKTMGMSLGFQISHSDLTAASGRREEMHDLSKRKCCRIAAWPRNGNMA
jgi:hypothetical protein